jgi:hypothetical protein
MPLPGRRTGSPTSHSAIRGVPFVLQALTSNGMKLEMKVTIATGGKRFKLLDAPSTGFINHRHRRSRSSIDEQT